MNVIVAVCVVEGRKEERKRGREKGRGISLSLLISKEGKRDFLELTKEM